jgi:hypothetical protein
MSQMEDATSSISEMPRDDLFERIWDGTAKMEEWTAAVSEGAMSHVAENIITVHITYFRGTVTAIRTAPGFVLIDTTKPIRPARP